MAKAKKGKNKVSGNANIGREFIIPEYSPDCFGEAIDPEEFFPYDHNNETIFYKVKVVEVRQLPEDNELLTFDDLEVVN